RLWGHGGPHRGDAWGAVTPALARDFPVVAPDQRGMGLSGKPADGYDTATLAADLVALMDALGHQRFAVAGHDAGRARNATPGRMTPCASRSRPGTARRPSRIHLPAQPPCAGHGRDSRKE